MKLLFISQNLPGYMEPMIRAFAAEPANTVLVASMRHRGQAPAAPIRRVVLKKCNVERYARTYAGYLELAMHTAQDASSAWQTMLNEKFYPDLICSCASNGTAFGLNQYFPESLKVSYADPGLPGCAAGAMLEARQLVQELQFRESDLNFAFCRQQIPTALLPSGKGPALLPLFTDTDYFCPQEIGGRDLLMLCGNKPHVNLNMAFDFLKIWLKLNPGAKSRILAENALAGAARPEFLAHFTPEQRQRIGILRNPEQEAWRQALAQSGLAMCLGSDAWPDKRLLDAMSAGTVIVTANAGPLLKPGLTCLHLPPKPGEWLDFVTSAIRQPQSLAAIRQNARQYVLEKHCQAKILPDHLAEIMCAMKRRKI